MRAVCVGCKYCCLTSRPSPHCCLPSYDGLCFLVYLFPNLTFLAINLMRAVKRFPIPVLFLQKLQTLHMKHVGGVPIFPLDEVRRL